MVIILAPHLVYPTHNGGDIYVDRLACYLSTHRGRVLVLGSNTLTTYAAGTLVERQSFANRMRSKQTAAVRTLMLSSHYLVEKYLTGAYRRKAHQLLQEHPSALVIYSCIAAADLAGEDKTTFVLTQNDDVAFYQNQFKFTRNPLHKAVAARTKDWTLDFLNHSANKHVFVHIADTDQQSYAGYMEGHRSIVAPAGVDWKPDFRWDSPADKRIRLLFCGSLSVKMNLDALLFFRDKFWQLLKDHFGEGIEVWVAGSRPTASVESLCKQQGWALYPDISDEKLYSLYTSATFGILPFEYSNGAKIKLLNYLSAGLPVLATDCVKVIPEQEFHPNIFSDDPNAWLAHLKKYNSPQMDAAQGRAACHEFAMKYSWQHVATKLNADLRVLGY